MAAGWTHTTPLPPHKRNTQSSKEKPTNNIIKWKHDKNESKAKRSNTWHIKVYGRSLKREIWKWKWKWKWQERNRRKKSNVMQSKYYAYTHTHTLCRVHDRMKKWRIKWMNKLTINMIWNEREVKMVTTAAAAASTKCNTNNNIFQIIRGRYGFLFGKWREKHKSIEKEMLITRLRLLLQRCARKTNDSEKNCVSTLTNWMLDRRLWFLSLAQVESLYQSLCLCLHSFFSFSRFIRPIFVHFVRCVLLATMKWNKMFWCDARTIRKLCVCGSRSAQWASIMREKRLRVDIIYVYDIF